MKRQTDETTNRQNDKQTNRQNDKQTNRLKEDKQNFLRHFHVHEGIRNGFRCENYVVLKANPAI